MSETAAPPCKKRRKSAPSQKPPFEDLPMRLVLTHILDYCVYTIATEDLPAGTCFGRFRRDPMKTVFAIFRRIYIHNYPLLRVLLIGNASVIIPQKHLVTLVVQARGFKIAPDRSYRRPLIIHKKLHFPFLQVMTSYVRFTAATMPRDTAYCIQGPFVKIPPNYTKALVWWADGAHPRHTISRLLIRGHAELKTMEINMLTNLFNPMDLLSLYWDLSKIPKLRELSIETPWMIGADSGLSSCRSLSILRITGDTSHPRLPDSVLLHCDARYCTVPAAFRAPAHLSLHYCIFPMHTFITLPPTGTNEVNMTGAISLYEGRVITFVGSIDVLTVFVIQDIDFVVGESRKIIFRVNGNVDMVSASGIKVVLVDGVFDTVNCEFEIRVEIRGSCQRMESDGISLDVDTNPLGEDIQ